MPAIKAIPTRYRGYHFRSRLEARWAVFLDSLGVRWEYEPEGYELPYGGRYLPDFWLPDGAVFLEIKPANLSYDANEEAESKAEGLAVSQQTTVFIASGAPGDALITWFAYDRRRSHLPLGNPFVAFDIDEGTGLLTVWDAPHEPNYEDPIIDAWGRTHVFTSYSGGFFASTYLVCHPGHEALEVRRKREVAGVTGPHDLPLSDRARKAVADARSARFEFGESGAS